MHGAGPMLVSAGPGSGKTTVITYRIHHLIHSLGISPEQILVITFTKAAAKQMKERFTLIEQNGCCSVTFSTFHAFFYHIIKTENIFNPVMVVSESEKRKILIEMIRREEDFYPQTEYAEEFLRQISYVRNQLIPLEEYSPLYFDKSLFIKIYQSYEEYMKKNSKVDFDDMMLNCLSLLEESEEVRKRWQDKFSFYLVDEFQDINPLQYKILRILTSKRNNIFCVGDEDQAIYGFRGASPEIMFSFIKHYNNVNQIYMINNYRSDDKIVGMANKIIKRNKNRFDKEVVASRTGTNKSYSIRTFSDSYEEYHYIANLIHELLKEYNLSDIVVLFRTNNVPDLFNEIMKNHNIPIFGVEMKNEILTYEIIEDIYAYFMLAGGNLKNKYFLRILEKPIRFISKDLFQQQEVTWESLFNKVSGRFRETEQIIEFKQQVTFIREMPVYGALHYLRKVIGYDKYILRNKREEKDAVIKILDDLQLKAKKYNEINVWLEYLEALLNSNDTKKENEEKINVLTIHAAKGLEWDCVIIPDINEGNYPFYRAKTEAELEEERRIFYVALTRAKKFLVLSCVENKYLEVKPSVYFAELML